MILGACCEALGCAPSQLKETGISPTDMLFLGLHMLRMRGFISEGWQTKKSPIRRTVPTRYIATRR